MAVLSTYIMAHTQARQRAIAAVQAAPDGVVVRLSEPVRSSAINAALHATLSDVAKTRKWAGASQDLETWKRLFVAAWSRATGTPVMILPALDGVGVDIVWRRTSQLSQRETSDLLAFIEAWIAETEIEA